MPVKQRQIIETADEDDEPTVSEADAERILDEEDNEDYRAFKAEILREAYGG